MLYFPLFFRMTGKKVLVVGGGRVAERKVKQLLEYGAVITLVSPEAADYLANLADDKIIEWNQRKYIKGESGDYSLVIATTDNRDVNQEIYTDAKGKNIPLNVVDQPDLCTVIFPATIRRGDMTVAISSDGKAPFLTKSVKELIDEQLPEKLARKAELAAIYREWLLKKCDKNELKNILFQKFLDNVDLFIDIWSTDYPPFGLWAAWLGECEDAVD